MGPWVASRPGGQEGQGSFLRRWIAVADISDGGLLNAMNKCLSNCVTIATKDDVDPCMDPVVHTTTINGYSWAGHLFKMENATNSPPRSMVWSHRSTVGH